jgi:hypothetical protein
MVVPTHSPNEGNVRIESSKEDDTNLPSPLSIEQDGGRDGDGGGGGGGGGGAAPLSPELASALRKVSRRVVPICFLVSLMNHLDRSK